MMAAKSLSKGWATCSDYFAFGLSGCSPLSCAHPSILVHRRATPTGGSCDHFIGDGGLELLVVLGDPPCDRATAVASRGSRHHRGAVRLSYHRGTPNPCPQQMPRDRNFGRSRESLPSLAERQQMRRGFGHAERRRTATYPPSWSGLQPASALAPPSWLRAPVASVRNA